MIGKFFRRIAFEEKVEALPNGVYYVNPKTETIGKIDAALVRESGYYFRYKNELHKV